MYSPPSMVSTPAIVLNSSLTSEPEPLPKPELSIYNSIVFDSNIDFKISYDDSDDEDYAFIYDEKSSSYKLDLIDKMKPYDESKVDENLPLTNEPFELTKESINFFDTESDTFERRFVKWYDEQVEILNKASSSKEIMPYENLKSKLHANDSINETKPLNDVLVESLENGNDLNIVTYSETTFLGFSLYLPFFPQRKLTMEEILNKFIEEGKHVQDETMQCIKEFKTTNEILLNDQNNMLADLSIKVYELLKVVNEVLPPRYDIKGITTRGGKSTNVKKPTKTDNDSDQNVTIKPQTEK
ncbi:hypothetical protein Tco_0428115 [Tanacetum coccineum]